MKPVDQLHEAGRPASWSQTLRSSFRKVKIGDFLWFYSDRHGRTNRATEDLQPPRKSCECLFSPHSCRSSVAQLVCPWRSKENQRKSPILIFAPERLASWSQTQIWLGLEFKLKFTFKLDQKKNSKNVWIDPFKVYTKFQVSSTSIS